MIMEATARHNILNSIIYKRKKWLPLSVLDRRKSLYQAVSAHLPTGNSAGTAYLHCIKDGTNIDPPYNTGNDFVYRDSFAQSREEYEDEMGVVDEDGERLFRNTETNGRFHSDWCSMIYPRLVLARNLLCDDGVIFISISEEEVQTLKQICNEVFGAANFRNAIFTRRYDKNLNRQFMEQGLATMNTGLEYILMYSKNQTTTYNPVFRASSEERSTQGYWKGFWNDADRPTMRYDVLGVVPESGQWKWKRELAEEAVRNYAEYSEKFSATMMLEEYWESTGKTKKFIRRNPKKLLKNQANFV